MKHKEIHFTINKDGSVQSTIKGMKGSACVDIAESLKSLGRCKKEQKTPDYYKKAEHQIITVANISED